MGQKAVVYLQQVPNVRVIVDNSSDCSDQLDHLLGHVVGRGSLATKDNHTWHHLYIDSISSMESASLMSCCT